MDYKLLNIAGLEQGQYAIECNGQLVRVHLEETTQLLTEIQQSVLLGYKAQGWIIDSAGLPDTPSPGNESYFAKTLTVEREKVATNENGLLKDVNDLVVEVAVRVAALQATNTRTLLFLTPAKKQISAQ